MLHNLISNASKMAKFDQEDFKSNMSKNPTFKLFNELYLVENFNLNEWNINIAKTNGHKKTLSMPQDLWFPPRNNVLGRDYLLSIGKANPSSFKHPLITINKPSKEEIERSKERQK